MSSTNFRVVQLLYSVIKHYDCMVQVICLVLTNQCASGTLELVDYLR